MRRAQEDERAERVAAIENSPAIIEVMSDDDSETNKDVRAPRPYRRLKPPYPQTAAIAEVEATVDVLLDIDARGEIGRVEIARWAGYGLDQSVIDTVRQMHFFPAMRDGVAIPMRVLLRYNFRKPPYMRTRNVNNETPLLHVLSSVRSRRGVNPKHMLYLSQVLGRPILDLEGERVATLRDVIVRLGEDEHPPVAGFVARYRRRDFFLSRWRILAFRRGRACV